MWSQQSGHTPMFLWGGCSIVPLQECAEPSCLWLLLDACSARLQAAAGWHRLEQLLLGGGIAHLPTDTEQAESVKHTHLLLCILPTFLRAWMDVQLSQAHTAVSVHSPSLLKVLHLAYIYLCMHKVIFSEITAACSLSLFCCHIILLFHDGIFLNRDLTSACIPHSKQLGAFW